MALAQPEILESRSWWLRPQLLGTYYMSHMLQNAGEHRAKMDNGIFVADLRTHNTRLKNSQ